MENTITDLNSRRRQTGAASVCHNDGDTAGRIIGASVLSAKVMCLAEKSAIGFTRLPGAPALAVRNDSATAGQSMACPPLPWRNALLTDGKRELLLERMLYFVLTATAVASLFLAFWQLRSLGAGWASFVELVGRIVS